MFGKIDGERENATKDSKNVIYGVAILSVCMLLGKLLGSVLGVLTGAGSEIGGIGFAMLLLILLSNCEKLPILHNQGFVQGLTFWKAMFIPVVVAMAASQNVFHMLSGGMVAIVAGAAAVGLPCLILYGLHKAGLNRKDEV